MNVTSTAKALLDPAGASERIERLLLESWGGMALVILIWAGIHLPGLGQLELKGEEGRRIMPAITMMATGNWLVPEVGGENYYNKPPLINWLVAGSFLLFGERTELVARLPSAAFVLLFVLLLVRTRSPWLSPASRLIAAIFFMTTAGMLEKGRLIEIEAIYICLTGIAGLAWLNLYAAGAPVWRLWMIPALPLGLGLLLKGPLILLFHYALVVAVLAKDRKLRDLLTFQHAAGLAVTVLVFALWAYPASLRSPSGEMTAKWWSQMFSRVVPDRIDYPAWALSFVRAVVYLVPWAVLLPFLWSREWISRIPEVYQPMFRGCRTALVACYLAINLLPGTLSRYSMPLLPLAAILLGWVVGRAGESAIFVAGWRNVLVVLAGIGVVAGPVNFFMGPPSLGRVLVSALIIGLAVLLLRIKVLLDAPVRLAIATALLVVCGMLFYGNAVVPLMVKREKVRPFARRIDAAVPGGARLHVYSPGYQPALFYVRTPMSYIRKGESVGAGVRYLFAEADDWKELLQRREVISRRRESRLKAQDRTGRDYEIVEFLP